jgi:hypothetical protein
MVHKILATADSLRKQRIDLRLLWVPSNSGVPGNEKADKLAKESVGITENHEFRRLLSAQKREHREDMIREWQQEWQASKNGQYLKRIHEGLPSKHVLRLHDGMSRYQTYFFTQLRLGHNWLKFSAKARRLSDDDK